MKNTMKKLMALALALCVCAFALTGCASKPADDTAAPTDGDTAAESYTVGVCQLMEHPSLDQATEGFVAALEKAMTAAGKEVDIDIQVAGQPDLCTTVINTQIAKEVDLIMANATPALLAAANGTADIPVLGTSVTDYADTFGGNIPANVSGTSDAVPFADQAQMMIDDLGLVAGDKVGVLYCINESNSLIQYEAVKAYFESKGIVVEAYTFSEVTELQAITTSMASECKAVYVPSDNTVASNDAIVGTICTEQNVPVYTSYGGAVCYAALAIDYYALGEKTGEMAAQILLGEKSPADLEVALLTPTKTYNADLCAQLGIEVPAA